jgi:23S rRNA pseudouridine1911/1915/1917 synthase
LLIDFSGIIFIMIEPRIVDLQPDYLVAYKPPGMHSVFLKKQEGREGREETLLDWCSRFYPEVLGVKGRNPWEGGIVHRLDYETEGLVLFARTQKALDSFLSQQKEGKFSKIYTALSGGKRFTLPGWPPVPPILSPNSGDPVILASNAIESGFRPYGPGRRAVRPVINPPPMKIYRSGILSMEAREGVTLFEVQIQRGFRHQIRCHLAWLGYPLVNDPLYGGIISGAYKPLSDTGRTQAGNKPLHDGEDGCPRERIFLALRAQGILFYDPLSGEHREYTLPPILPFL